MVTMIAPAAATINAGMVPTPEANRAANAPNAVAPAPVVKMAK
jgi:hypothetical protein